MTRAQDMLTKHKPIVAQYLIDEFVAFFGGYRMLLKSENYVARRQSLKVGTCARWSLTRQLLGEILLDRANFHVMTRFVADAENLKLVMNALRDKNRSIQVGGGCRAAPP